MATYTSTTTLSTINPSVYADAYPALKKFWITLDVSDPTIDSYFQNATPFTDSTYLENMSKGKVFTFKGAYPSINPYPPGVDATAMTYASLQTNPNRIYAYPWQSVFLDIYSILYADGMVANVTQPPFDWEDGVWHLKTYVDADEGDYESDAYYFLTESLDCCMAKYAAKINGTCTSKQLSKMVEMVTYRDMAYQAFNSGYYNTASLMLKKATELCSETGCNCGCD